MKTAKTTDRRKFLLAAGLGGAGVAAAVVSVAPKAKKAAAAAPQPAQGDGYRVSEHILKYYKTTEV
jgi:hypothetical protein